MPLKKKLIYLLLIVTLALGLAACGGSDDEDPTVAAPVAEEATATTAPAVPAADAPVPTSAPAGDEAPPASGDAVDAIRDAILAQQANLPMRMTMESEGEVTTMEMAGEDSFRMLSPGFGLIMVDGKAYMLEGESWTENPAMAAMAVTIRKNFDPAAVEESMGDIKQAEELADEEFEGTPARVYQFVTDVLGDGSVTSTSKLWVRKSDGLPIAMDATDDQGSPTRVRYEYDPNIVIEAPEVAAP